MMKKISYFRVKRAYFFNIFKIGWDRLPYAEAELECLSGGDEFTHLIWAEEGRGAMMELAEQLVGQRFGGGEGFWTGVARWKHGGDFYAP